MANNRKTLAYGSGMVQVSASVDDHKADLEEVFYIPDVHVRLLLLGKLESQGWGICLKDSRMELRDRRGDLFTVGSKVNNVYPMELIALGLVITAWMNDGGSKEPTHQEIVVRLDEFTMVTMAGVERAPKRVY